jgi:hypothetical protein
LRGRRKREEVLTCGSHQYAISTFSKPPTKTAGSLNMNGEKKTPGFGISWSKPN